jgi:hypothetical protein
MAGEPGVHQGDGSGKQEERDRDNIQVKEERGYRRIRQGCEESDDDRSRVDKRERNQAS